MLGQRMENYPDTATNLYIYVDDCDLAFNRALAAGGNAKTAPQDG